MIAMFVGDEDAVEVLDVFFDGRKPRQGFAFSESSINQEASPLSLE